MNPSVVPPRWPAIAIAVALALSAPAWIAVTLPPAVGAPVATTSATTNTVGAILVAVQGRVDFQRPGATSWERAQTNQALFIRDKLRTGPRSRATLQLSNLSIQRVDELSTLEIQADDRTSTGFQMELKQGGIYFFNREKPLEQRFKTPVASGAILGTEFALRVDPDGTTRVSLLEGEVELTHASGAFHLTPGNEATLGSTPGPHKTARLDAIAAVQWCLYYPAILDLSDSNLDLSATAIPAESLEAYRRGNLPAALAAYPVDRTPVSSEERVYLAGLVLSAGQVSQSETLLQGIQSEAADALRSLIATVRGTKQPAGLGGPSATSLLARSYADQAGGDLDAAREAAQLATRRSPTLGFAWVRLAEIEFSLGRNAAAAEALNRARTLQPENAQARALQGFVLAAGNDIPGALLEFEQAIALDPALGNAWLGRGLCRIRSGDLPEGRNDLQIAAATEPNRAVLRSYLAKAWDIEDRPTLAHKELGRAKELDPADPTSWLYAALIAQRENRINPAVDALERSRELNDTRAVYRSRLLLDQDRAMRSANLAGVYRDAGMQERSVREASRAVADDYANASAHRFLADSYDALRDPRRFNLRYETPWQSELLLAQLLAPVGAGSLSQHVSQSEYSKLFERDRVQFRSATEYTSAGDWHEAASQFGTFGNFSYALDVDHRSENGQQPNTDQQQTTVSGTVKQQFTPSDSGMLLFNYNTYENGDTRQYFDPTDPRTGPSQGYRARERHEPNAFLGWHHEWGPGQHTLLLAGHLDATLRASDTNAILPVVSRPAPGAADTAFLTRVFDSDYERALDAWTTELQHIATLGRHTLVGGVRYQIGEVSSDATQSLHNGRLQFPGPSVFPDVAQEVVADVQRLSLYAYDNWRLLDTLTLTAGLSYDRLDYPRNSDFMPLDTNREHAERVSPKVGLTWTPLQDTHLRAAWTRSLGGLFYDTSIRLEPVQVAGFNQAYRSLLPESVGGLTPGSRFETFGVGLDHKFPTRTYLSLSAELLRSESEQYVGAFDWARTGQLIAPPTTLRRDLEFEERTLTFHVNQLLGNHWSMGAFYRVSEAELDASYPSLTAGIANDPAGISSASMHQVGTNVRLFLDCGFFAEVQSLWIQQDNAGMLSNLEGEDFWQFHAFVGHRFLQRRAEVRLGILNIGNQDYRLNPLTLHEEYPRERTFYASLRLYF